MAETGSHSTLGSQLDIKQILSESQHRWLRPVEICEILRNYQKFQISPESPTKPVSGSIFLFDRKVLRYFRKDGHNWRKKKDGKTVKEAHEKLKVGSVDMLHCYYAHGEDNIDFQRRCYWLLEKDLMHIVFVHYLEVKGNKANFNYARNADSVVSHSGNDSSRSSSFHGTSPTSTSSAQEDAESEGNHQASSRVHSYPESLLTDGSSANSSSCSLISTPGNQNFSALNYASPSEGHKPGDVGGGSFISTPQDTVNLAAWQEVLGDRATGETAYKPELSSLPVQANWQHSFGDRSFPLHSHNMNQNQICNSPNGHGNNLFNEKSVPSNQGNDVEPFYVIPEQRDLQTLFSDAETGTSMNPNSENGMTIGDENYAFLLKKPPISGLQTEESLKKVDSFSRWIAEELEGSGELNMLSSTQMTWNIMGNEYDSSMPAQLQDTHTLNPSLSQDQLFSIIEISPNWVYSNLETKVLVAGKFLKSEEELSIYRWSIMLGELEVPAELLADGILCFRAPLHKPGIVPFYVTCSNRLACSEIREFEYRHGSDQNIPSDNVNGASPITMHLYQRFETILSLETIGSPASGNDTGKQSVLSNLMEENYETKPNPNANMSQLRIIGEMLLQKQLKEKFYSWIFQRVTEDGKGLTITDESGQSVLHLAAAVGFNWALQPIIVSGVSIDFRDVNGWTALHWAAFYGREDTVAALVSLGAAPGALTDPSAEYPLGRTPADLASCSGHKGISGFLAETSLTTHLTALKLNDNDGTPQVSVVQTVSERIAIPKTETDVPDTLSLKDSLAAVCNATQAAARIHQIFRIQSFQRKQFFDELLNPDEQAISLLAHSTGMANAAAVRIQTKFRGWKKRKEFLLIRQKIVKIQAHVRGHQVRKKDKSITWSVGILEKVILRWRRKGSGLRGFRSDEVPKGPRTQEEALAQEDNYDFLKEGRKQTEERMQKALTRVKSMAQNPEARAQYRRLLTAAEEFRETKDTSDVTPDNIEDMIYHPQDDLIDISNLWDDDTIMSQTFE